MILSDDIKDKIKKEFSNWVETQYAGKNKEDRQKLGQFFTPPQLTIKMIEKFDDLEGKILDPTAGCGGLLTAMILAGANPRKCYGIELDSTIANLCRDRLAKLGVPRFNIKINDALKEESYNFSEIYEEKSLFYFDIKNISSNKIKINLERNAKNIVVNRKIIIDYSDNNDLSIRQFTDLFKLFNLINEKEIYLYSENIDNKLNILNSYFKKYFNTSIIFQTEKLINF